VSFCNRISDGTNLIVHNSIGNTGYNVVSTSILKFIKEKINFFEFIEQIGGQLNRIKFSWYYDCSFNFG